MKKVIILLFFANHLVALSQVNWDYSSYDYEFSMTLTASIIDANGNSTLNQRIGVFEGDVCVGNAVTSVYLEDLDVYLAFLTIYSNSLQDEYEVVIYNPEEDTYVDAGSLSFESNENIGTISDPVNFFLNIDALSFGCSDSLAFNYSVEATYNDGSCILVFAGCTDYEALNFDAAANQDDSSCTYDIIGCTDNEASNYIPLATSDDGSCISWEVAYLDLMSSSNATINTLEIQLLNSQSSLSNSNLMINSLEVELVTALASSQPIYIDVLEGWNIIGYTLHNQQDVTQTLSSISSSVLLVKNSTGKAYIPAFNYNGIGNFIPGHGYQIKVSEQELNFTFPVVN